MEVLDKSAAGPIDEMNSLLGSGIRDASSIA